MLYRPVGLHELARIAKDGFARFPARLPGQPVFYPVVAREYAEEIARDWNTKDLASGFAGFVTQFEIDDQFARAFPVHEVGGPHRTELWIPANELTEFNRHIIGTIRVIAAYPGLDYRGTIDAVTHLPADLSSLLGDARP